MSYRALVVPEKGARAQLRDLEEPCVVPEGARVQIEVSHSSVNYKDAIALTGGPGILRSAPLVPGIDAVGTVLEGSAEWSPGRRVLVNGAGLGERTDGGLAESVVVPAAALLALPAAFSGREAAAIGTAGFTAALALLALLRHGISPDSGEVLVTGAGGGVGSFAVALLASAGCRVVASTGRAEERGPALRELGAAEVVDRTQLAEGGKPLQSTRWAAVVDSVGGVPLANALAQTRYGGVVAACGLAASADLPTTVMPFILRAVTLTGINSVDAPTLARQQAWELLARTLDSATIEAIAPRTVGLGEAPGVATDVLAGRIAGRVVVDVRG
ncbi:MAG: NADPH:quinone dehydrogenase [Naasia sp.]|jgi:acrylyl-CoA reductase (NADPH)|uniref:acrylyl-CoA reductase family protein n=1 Tax=Naasia sp. TaxID=2546198 RepID=UPI00263278AF|nr:acryloyl-CoA reductase [Naasia sp.]MCU1570218.1 NADPH:quinone dehydrogenase [Naasia sp.]